MLVFVFRSSSCSESCSIVVPNLKLFVLLLVVPYRRTQCLDSLVAAQSKYAKLYGATLFELDVPAPAAKPKTA
jgi:hypothetical protein